MSAPARRALVTGASGDLGRAMVARLLEEGVHVAAHYHRSPVPLAPLADQARRSGRELVTIQADLGEPREVRRMAEELAARWPSLDLLVNNAGGAGPRPLTELSFEEWERCLRINLTAPFLCIQATLPMLEAARGAIINVASVAGLTGGAFGPHYAAAKAGLIGLTRSAARELGPRGVRVNAVAPGPVESAMTRSLDPSALASIVASTALGRVAQPEEIAEAICWLASSGRAVAGQTLVIDCGRYLQ